MEHRTPCRQVFATVLVASLVLGAAFAQTITFEKLPDGSPTFDQQLICDDYAVVGVSFELVDRTSGEPIGCPRVVRFGPPEDAFEGCFSSDTASGAFLGNCVPAASGALDAPRGLACGPAGRLVDLAWGASCLASDVDYEGSAGAFVCRGRRIAAYP